LKMGQSGHNPPEPARRAGGLGADSDEGGHLFQSDPGHHSNLMAAR
jgi:hypothetical protein